jgi:N-acetylmuramoyl-L-alanine amidase
MKLYILILSCILAINAQAQIIVIDPGHGYNASGGNPDGRTATEINTALEVGLRLQTLLNNDCSNYTTYMTRSTANGWTSVSQRASMSNSWNGDYYLSIHGNAGGGSGTETFWCSNNDNSSTDDIAFATEIQSKMVLHGSWLDRRCVEDASFIFHLGVLSGSNATGCLNEIGFVDTPSNATKLNNSAWRDSFALAYKNAIVLIAGGCSNTPPPPAATNDFCANALAITSSNNCVYTPGTLSGCTSTFTTPASCDAFTGTAATKDVFYSFIATNTTHTIEVNPIGTAGDAVDAIISLRTGSNCLGSSEIDCTGGNGNGGGTTKTLVANNLNIGDQYWIRVYDFGMLDPVDPNFEICVTDNNITSLNNNTTASNITIYPNPSKGIFTINNKLQKTTNVTVYSTLNQVVYNNNNFDNDCKIDLSSQTKGIYFIKVQMDENIVTKKIIIE